MARAASTPAALALAAATAWSYCCCEISCFVDQLFVAAKIVLRLDVVRLGLLELRLGRLELLLCRLNSGSRTVHIGFAGRHLAAGIDGGDRNGDSCRNSGRLRIGEISLSAFIGDLIVGRIDLHQHRSRLHVLIVLDIEFDHVARDAAR